jgi:hypothetical protein
MGLLAPTGKLLNDLLVDLILSVQEANEVGIGHWCCTSGLSDQGRDQAAELVNVTGSRREGSSFSGLLTRVEIGHFAAAIAARQGVGPQCAKRFLPFNLIIH